MTANKNLIDANICDYCPLTTGGESVNTGPHNLCEGSKCNEAAEAMEETREEAQK